MTDIRTLTVEGTTYNIKDATARGDITTLQTNVTTLQTNVTQLQENTADLPQIRENVENNSDDINDLNSAFDDVYSQVNTVTEYNADLYQNGFFGTNGAFNSSQNYKTSNPINVESTSKISINKTYSASTISVIAFFDHSTIHPTTFISPAITSATDGVPVSVPSGAKYMTVSVANAYFDGLKITVIEDNIESNEKAIADTNEAIADTNEAIADINHNIGYPIITVTATTTAGWTEKKVAENIKLEANITYEFSISGTGTNTRYLRLADSNGTVLKVYNDTKDGSFEYTPTTNLTGCFLDYRSNISGATATISYRIKYPSILGDLDYLKSLGNPEIVIGSKLYAVVGDTVQIFFKSIIEGYTEDLIVKFSCDIGKNYPRYWEAVPVAGDVGNHTVTIGIYSNSGILVTSKTTVLTVKAASNPQSAKNVLCIGDSTMQNGEIPIEASRRLKGTIGVAITPAALSLNNISFVGRKQNSDNTVGWEGTGGWTFVNYMTAGIDSVRFTVTGADNINIGAVYTLNGFRLTIEEINVTSGSGNIRCTFAYKPSGSDWNSTSQTGTLTKYSGDGQNEIVFSAWVSESYQPFWNNNTDQFDIKTYVEEYCSEQCDYICILLGINSIITRDPFQNMMDIITNYAKVFCAMIHTQLPSAKILLSTLPLASQSGGIGSNYGSGGNSGMFNNIGWNHKVFEYNKALLTLEDDMDVNSYVYIINSHSQFDADYGYPSSAVSVNTRQSATIDIQTNAVHPNKGGYWQLSDVLCFRSILGLLA